MAFFALLDLAFAQDPVKVDPTHYRVLFENAHIRVLEFRDKPGDKAPMHSHPSYMTYVVGAGKTKVMLPDGTTSVDEEKGSIFECLPPTQHAMENVGTTETQEALIEFKDSPAPCSGTRQDVTVAERRDLPPDDQSIKPVSIEEEPHHHVLFTNEFVEVIRAKLLPGESTLFHTHFHDTAGFDLVTSTTTEQLLGKPEGSPSISHAGEVSADTCTHCPMTHRVHNVGNGLMDGFYVELLQRPALPSAYIAAPVAAENPNARVYNWMLAPGATSAMHTHKRPYLIVAVTPLQLKMTAPDGQSFAEHVKVGDFHWVDSTVTHTLTNEGVTEGQIVEIELK